jgi:hypothetical protein
MDDEIFPGIELNFAYSRFSAIPEWSDNLKGKAFRIKLGGIMNIRDI